jgi:NAD(P)-dependent dehydrogenase (short-subunit alcohol dehydrogenase family)
MSGKPSSRVALVTGAAGIIGPAIVKKLKAEGWLVVASDRDEESFKWREQVLGKPLPADLQILSDLSQSGAPAELVTHVVNQMGSLDAVIHAAAINHNHRLDDLDDAHANKEWSVNFLAALQLARSARPWLRFGPGSLVFFSSVRTDAPRADSLISSSTKAALEMATGILAGEFLEEGIRVNTLRIGVVPGDAFLRSELAGTPNEQIGESVSSALKVHLEKARKTLGNACVGTPEEIADFVSFCVDPRRRFLNGSVLTLDGGYLARMPGTKNENTISYGN